MTLFFDLCFLAFAVAIGIFQPIENTKPINEIALENCITLGVCDTKAYIG